MSSIAQHCRRRDSDDISSYSSYGSSMGSDDDTESTYSAQTGTHSQPTNTSSIGSRVRHSSDSESGISGNDSDEQSIDDSDNSDNSDNSGDAENNSEDDSDDMTTHLSRDLNTVTNMNIQQDLSQGSGDSNTVRAPGTTIKKRIIPPSTTRTNDIVSTRNKYTAQKSTNGTNTINNGKELWWGDGRDESTQSQSFSSKKYDQSTTKILLPPSRKETGSVELSSNQTRGKQHGDWKPSLRNCRLDGNQQQQQQQRGGDDSGRSRQPQQPSYKSDWRKQISAISDGMAASHWTMAGIDQHLLQTAKEEETWKKKKQDEKREVEWPSLLYDQGTSLASTHTSTHTRLNAPLLKPNSQRTNITTNPKTTVSSTVPDRISRPRTILQQNNDTQSLSSQPSNQQQNQSSNNTPTSSKTSTSSQSITHSPVTSPSPSWKTESSGSNQWSSVAKVPNQQMDTPKDINNRWTTKVDLTPNDSGAMDKAQHRIDHSQATIKLHDGNTDDKHTDTNWTPTPTPCSQEYKVTTSQPILSENTPPEPVSPPTRSRTTDTCVIISLPHTSIRKTKHGYLQKRSSTLEAKQVPIQATKDDDLTNEISPSHIDAPHTELNQSPPPSLVTLTLEEQLDLYYDYQPHSRKNLPIDAQWWRAAESQEIKESDPWAQHQQQQEEVEKEEKRCQSYYYTRPSMMPIRAPSATSHHRVESTPWMKSYPTVDHGDEHDEDDGSDYNRHRVPYTSPSGFHASSSQSFFGVAQKNTLFY